MQHLLRYSFVLFLLLGLNKSFGTVYTNNTSITVNDNAAASPYPSAITVAGSTGTITSITVTVYNVTHSYVHDMSIMLQGPGGQSLLLQSGVAENYGVSNLTYTFSDAAAAQLSNVNTYGNGTYKPTAYFWDLWPSPAPPTPPGVNTYQTPGPFGGTSATLSSVFGGLTANGQWKLWVGDFAGGDDGQIAGGWSLDITTSNGTPCPTDVVITGNYNQALTESDTWIVSSNQTMLDAASSITLEADSINGFIEFAPQTNTDVVSSEPDATHFMLAELGDGCSPLKPSSSMTEFVYPTTTLYPNPTRDQIWIKNPAWKQQPVNIEIYTSDGRLVEHLNYSTVQEQLELNVHHLSKGIYFMRVNDNNHQEVIRFVKE